VLLLLLLLIPVSSCLCQPWLNDCLHSSMLIVLAALQQQHFVVISSS
jgi:hypothetical protein